MVAWLKQALGMLYTWIDVTGLTGAPLPSLLLLLRQGLAYLALVGLGLLLCVVAVADGLAHLHGDIRTVMGPCHGNALLHGGELLIRRVAAGADAAGL